MSLSSSPMLQGQRAILSGSLQGRPTGTVIAQQSSSAVASSQHMTTQSIPFEFSRILRHQFQEHQSIHATTRRRTLETERMPFENEQAGTSPGPGTKSAVMPPGRSPFIMRRSASDGMTCSPSHRRAASCQQRSKTTPSSPQNSSSSSRCSFFAEFSAERDFTKSSGDSSHQLFVTMATRDTDEDAFMNDNPLESRSYENINQSMSMTSDCSLDTTSSSLEEHLLELMYETMAGQEGETPNDRKACINPVAWTLLHHDDEDDIPMDLNNTVFRDLPSRNQATTPLRNARNNHNNNNNNNKKSDSPAVVRSRPPEHATRPQPQRPFSSLVVAHNVNTTATTTRKATNLFSSHATDHHMS